ncbi:MAG: HAD-IC family P-type ATPase [Anaerolineae bacterium]|nr:HAD-IC family P-type ATPase [Anaerolineae bacterium]
MSLQAVTGLSGAEVAERMARGESNAYKVRIGRSYWQIIRDNVFNLFNIVLFVLVVIMISYGDTANVIFASFSVVLNSILGLVQEIRARQALDKLAAMAIQEVKVWRDGTIVNVPITQIVKDDVLPIEPGDRVVVDGTVLQADALEMDESLLTGESDAVLKDCDDTLFSGSFCIGGSGLMQATQVGENSTVNKLSRTAKAYKTVFTPTQQQINSLVQLSLIGMLLFGPMTVVAGVASRLPVIEIVRNAVVLVTSFVPQGLILVTTISLTIGALRISRRQTLVQRVNAVESLANVNVLCFDKTGTLTRNQLSVTKILPLNGASEGDLKTILGTYTSTLSHQNKTAAAIAKYAGDAKQNGVIKQQEIPFNSARKWGAVVLKHETLILGAPERVLPRDNPGAQAARQLAEQGQRVLALARCDQPPQSDKLTDGREPLALVVMSDQVRDDIQQTLNAFRQQGVALKVISGDNVETVSSIAGQAGMEITGAFTGDQLEAMGGSEFDAAVRTASIFARIEPDTKRKIINSLRRQGAYVAMVGDGVNDVPALKEASLAIAMNDGAQIAKDVADMVLLNNAMSTLPLAFAEGKDITQKIFATAKLFLTKNFYTILMFIFVGFMTLPFPTNPIQISWLTFGAVNIPAALILAGWLRQPQMTNFRRDVLAFLLVTVLVGAVGSAILYASVYLYLSGNLEAIRPIIRDARQIARSALLMYMSLYGLFVLWEIHGVDILNPRTWMQNRRAVWASVILIAITMLAPYLFSPLFNFVPPDVEVWIMILVVAFATGIGLRHLLRNNWFAI